MALKNGLVVMTPSSVVAAGTGSSASINADGSVDFASCTSLSLNGVFTSSYDNYMIVCRLSAAANDIICSLRLRAAGINNSTANSYVSQRLRADSTSTTGARITSDFGYLPEVSSSTGAGFTVFMFAPQIAQNTVYRAVSASNKSTAVIEEYAGTHNQATSYDGFTLYPQSSNLTGLITVFGFNQ